METNILLVKNMVCHRCVLAVEAILSKLEIPFQKVLFGEIHLFNALRDDQRGQLVVALNAIGFELIDDRLGGLVEKIKQLVIRKARNKINETESQEKMSVYLSRQLYHEYTYLSSLFSTIEGRTIEHYFIEQRTENAKELLIYGELTLAQIALELGYSSTAHLSSQFKKVTGLTPAHFRKIGVARRKALDDI